MSTLGYALLSLLAREPLTGYGLTKRMEERVGFFWRAGHSQIYPELARLEAAGLVAHREVEQRGKPDKKVYSITDEGLDALREWVVRPVEPPSPRDELVLKAYTLWAADPEKARALFREQERRHREKLLEYERIGAWMEHEWDDLDRVDSPHFASHAALRRGIGYERGYAEWCSWVAERLEGSSDGAGV